MLKHESTNMNMNGAIYVDETAIATVSGDFNGANNLYIHVSIPVHTAAIANKETFYTDLEAFIDQLFATAVDLND